MRRINRGLVRIFIEGRPNFDGVQCVHITLYSRTLRMRVGAGVALYDPEPSWNKSLLRKLLPTARAEWRKLVLGADWRERKAQRAMSRQYPGMYREPVRVAHASLHKWSDESAFKAHCPCCTTGLLLVARDPRTLRLRREDRCISCAQSFVYTDSEIAGEKLPVERQT